MNIQLNSEQEKFIQEKIASGEYVNESDIISTALKLLQLKEHKIKELKDKIAVGTEQIKQGRVTDGETVIVSSWINSLNSENSR
jgi:antitoxin ParD1/3/4